MKYAFIIFILSFPLQVQACFDGSQYEVSYKKIKVALIVTLVLIIAALFLRFKSNMQRLWVPLLMLTTYMYIPMYLVTRNYFYGGGDCGYGLVEAFYIAAAGAIIILIYEIYNFLRTKNEAT